MNNNEVIINYYSTVDKDILNIETEYKKNLEQLTFERRGHR